MQIATTWQVQTPTGYHLHLTPPTYTPHDPLAPQDPDRWTTQATPAETALHQATTLARAGHAPQAIAHLQTAARHPAPLPIRAALDLLEAHITHREGLTLIALAAATRAHRRARDPQTRNDALALALQINTHLPGSLALIAPDLADTLIDLAKTPPLDATTAHHAFETGRALLHLDDPDTAATLLRLAHHHRPLRDRARYLAYAAARLATDPEAATAHLDHLATRTLDPHLRAHTHAARARHHYEQARPTQAATAYALAATTADPDSPLAEAIRIEQGWLALRQAQAQTQAQGQPQPQPQATLNALLPLDLNHHAPPRALLIGTLYHHLCHPARAATIATALIDRLDRDLDPIGRQFATERVTLSRPRWQPVRDPLLARLAEHRDRYEALQTLNPDAFYHREALRLRISADARASDEAREAMRKDKPPPPPEPPMPTWTDAIWQEAAPITDRCPSLGVPSPLADSPSRDAK